MNIFVYKSSVSKLISLINKLFEKTPLSDNGVVVGGSVANSDFCASIPFIKKRLQILLLQSQASGYSINWGKENAP